MLIKNIFVENGTEAVDIRVADGKFEKIAANLAPNPGEEVVDCTGCLAIPPFIEPHVHLDTCLTAGDPVWNMSGTLFEGIECWAKRKEKLSKQDVKDRARRAVQMQASNGVQFVRTHVDVTDPTLIAMEGMLELKEELKGIVDIQIVAFPQEGIYANEGTEKLMWEAMEMGCDIAGGMPAAEWLPELARKHVDLVFEIAEKYNVPIDMHIDQSKDMFDRSLEYTAWLTLQKGWGPRVTGGHCTSITYQNQSHAIKVMKLIKEAGMNICTNTQVLAIMGIDAEPRTRGVTRIREMVEMGINVATAQDTICDGFHLYGTGDPLDYGLVGAYTAQYNTPGTAKTIFDMLTTNSMSIFDPDAKYGIEVGNDADLNILDADNIQEALRTRASRPYILRHGKVIASFERKAALL